MSFVPPAWACNPSITASLKVLNGAGITDSVLPIDCKPYYVLGSDPQRSDVHLTDSACSPVHAALVWHENDVLYLIDLHSASGSYLDSDRLPEAEHLKERSGSKRNRSAAMEPKGPIACRHLLVKHRDVRNPKSWKEPNVTRSKDEALQMIEQYRQQITSGKVSFEDLASTESHCSSAKRGGDLGTFGPGQMQPAFEHAAYDLKVGQLSQPVFSDSGVHLIYRYA
ncbi:hypothetical protein WJX73_006223 [Symbiochloris irregularis]|uniref:Peptidyl-prolyl cis-trans isomerase n=1 Tax=Symbiochloris irregularis TaxID=706552 RepID=A0AAW1PW98_9CHLO